MCMQEHKGGGGGLFRKDMVYYHREIFLFATIMQFAADVVGCNRDPSNDMVVAVDTWNPPQDRTNTLDTISNVMLLSSNFNNGRISCT